MNDHDDAPTYCIIRFRRDGENSTIKEGLTLEEAKEHCSDPESDSKTATSPEEPGVWFDGFEEE